VAYNLRFMTGGPALGLFAATAALAQDPPPAQLTVTAQIQASCTLESGTLPFGLYTGDQKDAAGQFAYECTDGASITLGLGPGSHAQGATRRMSSGGGFLNYEIYTDPGRTTVWGTDDDGVQVPSTSAEPVIAQVYGRIPGGQQSPTGNYTDTVQITLNID
jgi:spore coat protein U-like protein